MTDLVERLTALHTATLGRHQELSVDTPLAQETLRERVAADVQAAEEVRVLLDVCHRALLAELESCGLAPRLTILHGDPQTALDGLRAGPLNRATLGDDLRIEELSHPRHIEPIVTLLREYFESRPLAGIVSPHVSITAAGQARLDELTRDNLNEALAHNTAVVVLRDDEVMGRTANPAVLHLARRMKRPLRGWQLEPAW